MDKQIFNARPESWCGGRDSAPWVTQRPGEARIFSKPPNMSRAFVKEDVDRAERKARRRGRAGLPPGAANFTTAQGAETLRARLGELRAAVAPDAEAIGDLERVLASATVVEPRRGADSVVFGSRVTLRLPGGEEERVRIVGVDEVELDPDAVSWVSPVGKALLGAEVGQRVRFPDEPQVPRTVARIE